MQVYDYGTECPGWLGFESSLSLAYRGDLVSLWPGDSRTASVRWIFLRAHQGGVMLLGATVTCELRVGWVPEGGHRYDATYANTKEACHVRVTDRETVVRSACTRRASVRFADVLDARVARRVT